MQDETSGGLLTKTGAGRLTLFGANTYSGPTIVSNGTLMVNGSIGSASALLVEAGGSLGGFGSISGPVTIKSGATLAPNNLGYGFLNISSQLTLATNSFTRVVVNKDSGLLADYVYGLPDVSYNGTMVVSNASQTATLTEGDQFNLFSASAFSGNFTSISGSPGAGLAWIFNPTNGVLSVVAGAPAPTNLVASVIGGELVLDWPNGQGWRLEAQTNNLATGLGTNWVEIIGATSPLTNVISPAKGSVFYRLIYP
jgi:autotransporter-associated beta strand protein